MQPNLCILQVAGDLSAPIANCVTCILDFGSQSIEFFLDQINGSIGWRKPVKSPVMRMCLQCNGADFFGVASSFATAAAIAPTAASCSDSE